MAIKKIDSKIEFITKELIRDITKNVYEELIRDKDNDLIGFTIGLDILSKVCDIILKGDIDEIILLETTYRNGDIHILFEQLCKWEEAPA